MDRRRVVVGLLAALLTALGLTAPHGSTAAATPAGPAVDGSSVYAAAPVRAAGRPVAEPSLLTVHGPATQPVPLGTLPSVVSPMALVRLGSHEPDVPVASQPVRLPTVGGRAPPSG